MSRGPRNRSKSKGKPGSGAVDEFMRGERGLSSLSTKDLGDFGEILGVSYLEGRGYEILEYNYRCCEGEADIVAYDRAVDQVVLVEVKTRREPARGGCPYPEEAVDERKLRRYRRIASMYALDRFPISSMRFDVLAITVTHEGRARLKHLYDLFSWGGMS